ncbi:hypothetical protein NPIL_562121 [Nephila pilipes]|uniref:Uncharacterized protein n=1 Tax=Nephila pilipes TaxID=299642 RepID=A0A8X6N9T6_NEPPI|nr:hypothetical protein NPIL_562121 [Nephila pilipes]
MRMKSKVLNLNPVTNGVKRICSNGSNDYKLDSNAYVLGVLQAHVSDSWELDQEFVLDQLNTSTFFR